MRETVFRSDELPAADRFDHVRELMSLSPLLMDASSDHSENLLLHQRDLQLDAVRVWSMTFQPMNFHRTAKLIQRSDPESYNFCLLLNGEMGVSLGGREAIYGPGELYINDSSQPYDIAARCSDGLVSCVGVEIPRRLLSLPPERVDRLIGRPIPGRHGMGGLLAQFLRNLTGDATSYRPTDGCGLGLVVSDLAGALIAHHTAGEERDSRAEPNRRSMVLRIRAFIQNHLDDPHLSPRTVAAAHHISPSYLHRLFEDEPRTVAALIRDLRMERARGDLADQALRSTPIHAIAARWGFRHAAHFTRAFRSAYGMAPNDYRCQFLQDAE
ncbi:helix-turn-helix domain-containing protein [Actinomadura viridis]|uniref:AraC-like DNA-binding protein n=1 Tax=Actinomadura viridis TaxID=58110 RepID=A0A931GGS2_9ACTN|nr:helix-turn-helix domain-containing protein [Actinomadura viridis]MBG6086087.1 AraC-like DNA-binding protein [Actinomadura viridis]